MRKRLAVALVAALTLTITIFGFGVGTASADNVYYDGSPIPPVGYETTGVLVHDYCGYSSLVNGCTTGPVKYQATDITPKLYSAGHKAHDAKPHSLAYTGNETAVAGIAGLSLLVAGGLVMDTRRRVRGVL